MKVSVIGPGCYDHHAVIYTNKDDAVKGFHRLREKFRGTAFVPAINNLILVKG